MLRSLFELTQDGPWETYGKHTQFYITRIADVPHLVFQGSADPKLDGAMDWKYNLSAWIKPYKRMNKVWFAHHGFVTVWKAIEDHLKERLQGETKLVIAGYSHGAALTTLAHEYFTFNGVDTMSYAFAGPRVLWFPPKEIDERFDKYTLIRNTGDLVTHAAPAFTGYKHVGNSKTIGYSDQNLSVKWHYPNEYRRWL